MVTLEDFLITSINNCILCNYPGC